MPATGSEPYMTRSTLRIVQPFLIVLAIGLPRMAIAQVLTGALLGTVKDEQGAALPGAVVRVTSPALIGGPLTVTTNERGHLRFPVLTPGSYTIDIELE